MNPFFRNILQRFNKNLEALAGNEYSGYKYLVAVSGGADSMALIELCRRSGLDVALAHCNFSLRGKESDADEEFVMKYAASNGIPAYIRAFDTKAEARMLNLSVQETARKLRYDWFYQLCDQGEHDYILSGHHEDDRIETFIINLMRGAGPKGLSSIPPRNNRILRPLLGFQRQELEIFCNHAGIDFRTDSSNQDDKYNRNFIRNQILPLMESRFPGMKGSLSHVMKIQDMYFKFVESRIEKELYRRLKPNSYGMVLDLNNLPEEDLLPFILIFWLGDLGFSNSDIEDMTRCLQEKKSGARFFANGALAVSDREKVIYLDREVPSEALEFSLEEGEYHFHDSIFIIKKSENLPADGEIKIPEKGNQSVIKIRARQDGDRIRSLGMKGKSQKLQDIYTNARLNYLEKLLQPVVLLNETIIWLPGLKKSVETEKVKRSGWIIRHKKGRI